MVTGSRGRSLTVAALIFAALLAGCGVPGEPLPPLLEIPVPATDLSVAQEGADIQLTWSPIQLSTEGTRVGDFFDRIEIYGVFLLHAETLRDFAGQSHVVANTRDMVPMMLTLRAGAVLHLAADQVGKRAFFGIKAINRKNKDAGFSNIFSLEIVDLPEPPVNLRADVTEKAIQLSWKPGANSAFGGPAPPVDGYWIDRVEVGPPIAPQEIGKTTTPSYQDTTFEFGHTYVYTVQAYVTTTGTTAMTTRQEIKVVPKDIFPPAAPQNVRAVAVPGAIEIAWSPNSESDLAGYNVYRSEGGSSSKLTSQPLSIPIYRDPGATAGAHYVYRVTAIDRSGNESAPSEDVSITAE